MKTYTILTKEKSKYVIYAKNKVEARAKFRSRYKLKIESITQQIRWTKAQKELIESSILQLEKLYRTILYPYRYRKYYLHFRKLRAGIYTEILRKKF